MNFQSRPRLALLGLMLAIGAAAATLRAFPPSIHAFYPRCPIHALTGWQCPGCGSTRAIGSLLAGDWVAAIHYNALLVALLPAGLAYAFVQAWSVLLWDRWRPIGFRARSMTVLLIASLLFGITRNLVP